MKTTSFWAVDLEFHLPVDAPDTQTFPAPPSTRATARLQY